MAKKVHLVIICQALAGSGAVAHIAKQHIKFLCQSYDISVLSDTLPKALNPAATYIKINSRKFDYLRRFCHVPNELAFVLGVKKALYELNQSSPIDAVLCHSHTVSAIAAKKLLQTDKVSYVLVIHGDIFDRPAGTYDFFLTNFYKWATPIAYKYASSIIALSPYLKTHIINRGVEASKIHMIPNGIDLQSESVNNPDVNSDRLNIFTILFVGRLSVEKGLNVLIQACRRLNDLNLEFRLVVIGDGPKKAEYASLIENSDLKLVEFKGFVPRCDIYQYYRLADVVCVPSLSDSLPAVVLEAMAMGTVVIGSNTGGIPFMVVDGLTGLLFDVGDETALADKIKLLAEDPDLRTRMAQKAKQHVDEIFSWPKLSIQIRSVINGCLELRK